MSDKVLSFADRRRARQRPADPVRHFTLSQFRRVLLHFENAIQLSRPYPEACSLLVAHILEIEALRRARQRPPQAPGATIVLPPDSRADSEPDGAA